MTALRQRMLEDMQLRGFSARTQGCYVAAVRQLAEHYHRSPDLLTDEDLRQYLLYLANDKKVARATATIALCGIRFFFEQTLRRELVNSMPSRLTMLRPVSVKVLRFWLGQSGAERQTPKLQRNVSRAVVNVGD